MQEEIWKDAKIMKNGEIIDFTGLYEVSNLGRIRNVKTGYVLKPYEKSNGYMQVDLKQEHYSVHRIVATTFIINNNPQEKTHVNHKDENPKNNCVENLEWCTHGYNVQYSYIRHTVERKEKIIKAKGEYEYPIMCVETQEIFESIREASRHYGLDASNIVKCLKGKRRTTGGYHWQYVD